MNAVIVGGGIVGLSTAFSLSRRGWDVTVLESSAIGSGASTSNAGWIVPSLATPLPAPGVVRQSVGWMLRRHGPLSIRLRADPALARWFFSFWRQCTEARYADGRDAMARLAGGTHACFDALRSAGIEFEGHRRDLLVLCTDHDELEKQKAEVASLRRLGFRADVVDDVRSVEPIATDAVVGAVRIRGEQNVRPDQLIAGLERHLRERGVDVRRSTHVSRIRGGRRGGVVETTSDAFAGDAVVVAAGVWTSALVRPLGARLPMEAGKGYTLDYEPTPVSVRNMLYLYEGRVALSPLDGRVRIAGTVELGNARMNVAPRRVEGIVRTAGRYLRDWPVGWREVRCASGLRPMTPDGLPAIGPVRHHPGIVVATGHGKQGLTLGPVTGEAVADYLETGRVPDVLSPFDPGRFDGRREG